MRSLVYDVSNILFRVAAVQKGKYDTSPEDLVGLCMHVSLLSSLKWYTKYKPDFVVFGFEGGNNWRKKYTAETQARLAYKGNRAYDPSMQHFYELIDSFKEVVKSHTSICCLSVDEMEGDDVIGAYTQMNASPENEILIVSGDRDFVQLLKLPNVKLVNPDNGKLRNQPGDKDYVDDLDYWLFLKCVRGDMGDYVPSAYPRVRETKVKKAYDNAYDRINFMNETWKSVDLVTGNDVTYRVGDLYEQNVVLLSLFDQPAEIRQKLEDGVKEQIGDLGSYSHFHFLKFLEKFELKKVRQDAMRFADMFSNNQRFLKNGKKHVQAQAPQKVFFEDQEKEDLPPKGGLLEF